MLRVEEAESCERAEKLGVWSDEMKSEQRGHLLTVVIVMGLIGAWSLIAFLESRPGPHYALGHPPGTICTNYGTSGAVVCERDPNFKPAAKP